MARSSLHRRDGTLDLVQIVPKVDKIILVFTTTRNLSTGTLGSEAYDLYLLL